MTNTLNLSTWSNRSHVSDAIPQNRLIQPSNFDYTITLLLSVRTLDSTEINPHISEASDIQFVASSVSVAGFRGYSVYVAGLFGLSMNYTNWLCGFTTALWIVYLDRMWYLLPLLCHWRVVVFSCLVIHIMSLDSSIAHWIHRCTPYVVEPVVDGGFHELDSLFFLYHPNHDSVEMSLVFRVSLPFPSHIGWTYSPSMLFALFLFVQFSMQCSLSQHSYDSTCVLSKSVFCSLLWMSLGMHWGLWLSFSCEWFQYCLHQLFRMESSWRPSLLLCWYIIGVIYIASFIYSCAHIHFSWNPSQLVFALPLSSFSIRVWIYSLRYL